MNKSIKLVIASILASAIGMASIPASYASSATSSGQNNTVGTAGHSSLIAKAKKKVTKKKGAKKGGMMKKG